jgi:hypothetical protein
MRVVVAEIGRPLSGRCADEDEMQAVPKLIGQALHGPDL